MQFTRVSPGPNRGMSRAQESGNRLADPSACPDGTPQKLFDVSKLSALGWSAKRRCARA
jgi:hypothetical protein